MTHLWTISLLTHAKLATVLSLQRRELRARGQEWRGNLLLLYTFVAPVGIPTLHCIFKTNGFNG